MSPVFSAENRGGGPVDAPADTARRCAYPGTCCCRCSETPSRPRNPWPRGLPARRAQRAPPRTRTGAGCPWAGWPAPLCPALATPPTLVLRTSFAPRAPLLAGRRVRRPPRKKSRPDSLALAALHSAALPPRQAPARGQRRRRGRWSEPIPRLPRPCYLAPSLRQAHTATTPSKRSSVQQACGRASSIGPRCVTLSRAGRASTNSSPGEPLGRRDGDLPI